MRIDAHQHYGQPGRGDYDWMPKEDPTLSRPYFPAKPAPIHYRMGIERTILIQAAATAELPLNRPT